MTLCAQELSTMMYRPKPVTYLQVPDFGDNRHGSSSSDTCRVVHPGLQPRRLRCRGREIYRQLKKDSIKFSEGDTVKAYANIEQTVIEKNHRGF